MKIHPKIRRLQKTSQETP